MNIKLTHRESKNDQKFGSSIGRSNIIHNKKNKKKTKCSKSNFKDKKHADASIHRIGSIEDGRKKPVRSYRCDICRKWHITSQEL